MGSMTKACSEVALLLHTEPSPRIRLLAGDLALASLQTWGALHKRGLPQADHLPVSR